MTWRGEDRPRSIGREHPGHRQTCDAKAPWGFVRASSRPARISISVRSGLRCRRVDADIPGHRPEHARRRTPDPRYTPRHHAGHRASHRVRSSASDSATGSQPPRWPEGRAPQRCAMTAARLGRDIRAAHGRRSPLPINGIGTVEQPDCLLGAWVRVGLVDAPSHRNLTLLTRIGRTLWALFGTQPSREQQVFQQFRGAMGNVRSI